MYKVIAVQDDLEFTREYNSLDSLVNDLARFTIFCENMFSDQFQIIINKL